jgi:hypothetical protein
MTAEGISQRQEAIIAIFKRHADLSTALRRLADEGIESRCLTVMAKGGEAVVGATGMEIVPLDAIGGRIDELATRISYPGLNETVYAAIGGYLGLLGSLALVMMPPIGLLILAGEEALMTLITLGSSVAGMGMGGLLGAVLTEHAIEKHRVLLEECLAAGDWVLVVRGDENAVQAANRVLRTLSLRHRDLITLAS